MNLRLNLFLLVVVALLGGWYLSQQNEENPELAQLIKKAGQPEYVGDKMTTSVYDLDGKPQYQAEAQEIKRYEESERTEFIQPLLNLFSKETALKQWKLSADHADISKEKILTLQGNVKLESLDPTSRLQAIETDHLRVDLNTQDISTDATVKSRGLGFSVSGIGLTGNLKRQVATLQRDVKTHLEPTQLNSNSSVTESNKDAQ